ncbi:MAG TPA: TIGR03557 family F420-dependent LLM class oxidoreductase [Actinomycetota bacterium]|nr:TIGR03557 family F420-dependent LLM class oxidoreductase [Actinomycetota bacterium]
MLEIGYTLSAEEHGPADLVRNAAAAEEAGFDFLMVSDHFHPWIDRQGHSPFVWGVLGAISQATKRVKVGTGVTCPILRMHPAIVAHAAATAAVQLEGRFLFGVGSGENLNEHVIGERWPSADERLEMLEEAVEVLRVLWKGGFRSHRGRHFHVEDARIYDLPEEPPPILLAVKGDKATELAGRIGDGLIGLAPEKDIISRFESAGGSGKPTYGQVHVCWAKDEATARRTAHEWWPNTAVPGELTVELPLPRHFEQASENVSEEAVADKVVCGPDPDRHLEAIREFASAGYDHVWIHQIGPDQAGFLRFYEEQVLPKLR